LSVFSSRALVDEINRLIRATKSAVSVQHNQIENRDAAEQMKAYWHKKLEALEKALT